MRPFIKGRRAFTLIEILVAIAVFASVTVSTAGIFFFVHNAWQTHKKDLNLIQNARWAIDFMTAELRSSYVHDLRSYTVDGESVYALSYNIYDTQSGSYSNRMWFWREGVVLYRGEGDDFTAAHDNRVPLADSLKEGTTIFEADNDTPGGRNNFIKMEVEVESKGIAGETRTYKVRGQVIMRHQDPSPL